MRMAGPREALMNAPVTGIYTGSGVREGLYSLSANGANTGPIVDAALAFLDALSVGKIGAAGLDVYWHEPLPDDHSLLEADNVVLTPHTGYNTPESVIRIHEIAVDNLVQFFAGHPVNVVR